jgi:glucose/mannose-6-phosphate isomerase
MSDEEARSISELADELDSEGMLAHLRNFPEDLDFGNLDEELTTRIGRDFEGAVYLGMGGSAAAADFIASLSDNVAGRPVTVWRDYGLPAYVDSGWLVIATSYSGNTEETLSGVQQALESGIPVVGISSGGRLQELLEAADDGWWIPVPGGQPPRSAFGHLFSRLLQVSLACGRLGLSLDEQQINAEEVREAVTEWDFVNNPESQAIDLALLMQDRQVGIVSAPELACAGVRFANQLNENGGVFARPTSLPEMNHNEIIAWTEPEADDGQMLILLTWGGMNERVEKRIEWMFEAVGADICRIHCEGEGLLDVMLTLCVLMDWISCAVALSRGKDPSAVGPIQDLKDHLSD